MANRKIRKIFKNNQLINKLKKYYQSFSKIDAEYNHSIRKLEEQMQKEFKTSEIEFFCIDGEYVGIGTPLNPKIMKLIQFEELEN